MRPAFSCRGCSHACRSGSRHAALVRQPPPLYTNYTGRPPRGQLIGPLFFEFSKISIYIVLDSNVLACADAFPAVGIPSRRTFTALLAGGGAGGKSHSRRARLHSNVASQTHPACWMVKKVGRASNESELTKDPIQLAWMVNQVARRAQARDLAEQPSSRSTRGGWEIVCRFVACFSHSTLFTIRASRMGSEYWNNEAWLVPMHFRP